MGIPSDPGPRIQPVKQPRTATATTGFPHVEGETVQTITLLRDQENNKWTQIDKIQVTTPKNTIKTTKFQ